MIMILVKLVITLLSSYIVIVTSVNPKLDIRRVNIDLNKIPYIDSIRKNKNSIVDISKKSFDQITGNLIPQNYEVLSNVDVNVDSVSIVVVVITDDDDDDDECVSIIPLDSETILTTIWLKNNILIGLNFEYIVTENEVG